MRKEHNLKSLQAAETRQRLIETARTLFAEQGYGEVSLDEMLKEVRLTKGALYHHFRDKKDLFREVLEAVQREVALCASAAGSAAFDPTQGLKDTCGAFLRELQKPDVMRIVCIDAGAVLTWAECAEIDERHMLAVLRGFINAAHFPDGPLPLELEALTRVVAGAIYQTVEWASHADTINRMAQGEKVILRLAESLTHH